MAAAVRFIFLLSLLPLSLSISDQEALHKFKSSLKDDTGALVSWNQNTSPCDPKSPWRGVLCFNGIVTGLRLSSMDLSGTVDVEALLQLEGIRTISIVNNSFSGPIPEFNRLGALKAMFLSRNQFSGEIAPDYFQKMGSLKKIWLSGNKFSGKIPDSLGQIQPLIELHLEYNEFAGAIPEFEQSSSLSSLDMSHNKLEGEIPASLTKFGTRPFQGNADLCGKLVGKECNQQIRPPTDLSEQRKASSPPPPPPTSQDHSKLGWWLILGASFAALVIILLVRSKQRDDRFVVLGKENPEEVVAIRVPSSNRRSENLTKKGNGSSARRGQGGRSMGDLVIVNNEKGEFGMSDLMKAAAEVLGNGGLGSAYKAILGNVGISVVVKRMRELNKMSRDAFDSEVRRLGGLRHPNILPPLAYHYRKEEKLMVSEFVSNGSLLYLLHGDRGTSHAELNWPRRLKIIQGVAQGLGFLHTEFASYEIPHGNLKSSNILLNSTYEPLLSDYAFHPLMNNTQAVQVMFAYKSPEAVLYQQVSPKSDVYCLGIVILEVLTGKFPSQYLSNQKGGTDVVQWVRTAVTEKRETELIDPEIGDDDPKSVEQMVKLLHIGADCTESTPDQRMDLKEAISRIERITV